MSEFHKQALHRMAVEKYDLRMEIDRLAAELEELQTIADAAKNLIAQKGRHNTEIAYKRLEAALAKGEGE